MLLRDFLIYGYVLSRTSMLVPKNAFACVTFVKVSILVHEQGNRAGISRQLEHNDFSPVHRKFTLFNSEF